MKKYYRFIRLNIKYKELIHNQHRMIKGAVPKSGIKIVFVIDFAESWNSVQSLYQEARLQDNVEVLVLTLPKPDFKHKLSGENKAQQLMDAKGIPAIPAWNEEEQEWFDLEKYEPTYVFYSRPYNGQYPQPYLSTTVCKYAKVCYIPYAYNMMDDNMFYATYPADFVLSSYRVYAPNESRYKRCEWEFKSLWKLDKNRFRYYGYPRFDLLNSCKKDETASRTPLCVTWLPRWTTAEGGRNKASHFLEYYQRFLDYADSNKDIQLVIRPHPLMLDNYINSGVMTKEEVEIFKQNCLSISNVVFDDNPDYMPTLANTDVLVADYTSLLVEFFVTYKDIIYCDSSEGLSPEGKAIVHAVRRADSFEEIVAHVDSLRNKPSDYTEEQKEILKKTIPVESGTIGKTILEDLVTDYYKTK